MFSSTYRIHLIITTDNFFPKCRPQDLENPITLTDDARNFMNFLNHGRPDLVIPSAADDLLPPGDEAGDAEDNLEDDEAASLGDQVHVVDDGFEGGSIDFGDEVVVDSNLGDPQAENNALVLERCSAIPTPRRDPSRTWRNTPSTQLASSAISLLFCLCFHL